jgi:Kef-type K+ transport system membrane component KefB
VTLTPLDLSIRFFLQLVVILAACQATGWVFRRIGQSQVVSEMIAGVLLGPSFLGWLFPSASAYLFPKASMPILFSVAQVGLVLYMFVVGLDFDLVLIRARARGAALVSAAGIAVPFALGGLLAWRLHGNPAFPLFGERVSSTQAVLFMGAAMSITAFPMLARIVHEQGLSGTALGTLVLAAGSLDDAAAWCLLAIVLSAFSGDPALAALGLVILVAACAGKGLACWGAAWLAGADRRDAAATGALMNARGLMELIILNIGLERGIIQPTLFTLMVLMAVVTTLAATPLFERVYGRRDPGPDGALWAG